MIAKAIANEKIATEIVLACGVCGSNRIQKIDSDFNFCRCESCGFIFDSPRPSFAEISAFYSQAGKYDVWLDGERARDLLWKRRLKKLLRTGAKGRLLDIGTGYGQFLHHARSHFAEVSGTEISESAVALAKEKYGLSLLAGEVEALGLPPQSFDTITLFHVLEHVPDPGKLVTLCHDLLRAQGILVIAVPNDVVAWTLKDQEARQKARPQSPFRSSVLSWEFLGREHPAKSIFRTSLRRYCAGWLKHQDCTSLRNHSILIMLPAAYACSWIPLTTQSIAPCTRG